MRTGERRSSASPERDKRLYRSTGIVRVYRATFEASVSAARRGEAFDIYEAEFAATHALVWLSAVIFVHRMRGLARCIEPPRKD